MRAGQLVEAGALQMSLFDQRDMAAITSPDYPGERLIVCRNPDLARERTRKREDLLAATEADLAVVNADSKVPKCAEVKFPSCRGDQPVA